MSGKSAPEPWLRGTIADLHPLQAAVLYSYQQVTEDLREWTAGLSDEDVWECPCGLAPLGFQLRHIAGSVERLTVYLRGGQLDESQMAALKNEMTPGASLAELLLALDHSLAASAASVREMGPERHAEARGVGRKGLPTTVGGLLVHLAEHSQRHLGMAIITVKVLKAAR